VKRLILKRYLSWFAGLVLLLSLPNFAHAGAGRARLDAFLNGLTTLEANFAQTLVDEKGKAIERSNGIVYLQRPGRFRWNYKQPYQQEIIADGQKVWVYDPELEQVTVKTLDEAVGNTPALLLGGGVKIDEHFLVKEEGSTGGFDWVTLKPKGKSAQYSAIKMGFNTSDLAAMHFTDNLGQTTRILFDGVKRNPRLSVGLFNFKPPPGVDVLEAGKPKKK
jgi:outer membrane lipoprotein carrier protein